MDIESDDSMECDIPRDNKLEAQSEVVNMQQGDKVLHTEPYSDYVGPVDFSMDMSDEELTAQA